MFYCIPDVDKPQAGFCLTQLCTCVGVQWSSCDSECAIWMTEQLILIAWAFKYTIPGSRRVGESRALDTAISSSIFKTYPLKSNTKQETLET
jgi:hypothetical protein